MQAQERRHWQQAGIWLQSRRWHYPVNADVWDLCWRWRQTPARATGTDVDDNFPGDPNRDAGGERLLAQILTGDYRLSPMQKVQRRTGNRKKGGNSGKDGNNIVLWSASDALVLKWLTLQLQPQVPQHPSCTHIKGRGGVAGARKQVTEALSGQHYRYLYRTDIRSYYRHIRKDQVSRHIRTHVNDPVLIDLAEQYLDAIVDDGGEYFTPKGIPRDCALSPLIGGSLLYDMDADLSTRTGMFYLRYMDDVILLATSRWRLRRACDRLFGHFDAGGFDKHPNKTHVGRLDGGATGNKTTVFDWLGLVYSCCGRDIMITPRPTGMGLL